MAKVVQKFPGEKVETMLRRFKKKLEKDNTLKDLRKHDYYLSPSEKRKLKAKFARQRLMREEKLRAKLELKKLGDKNYL